MIDISDGLSTDLGHLCKESRVGAEIQAGAIPVAVIGKPAREVELRFALHGGEDYELLFTAPRGEAGSVTDCGRCRDRQIGQVTRGRRVFLERDGIKSKFPPQGWEHFKKARTA